MDHYEQLIESKIIPKFIKKKASDSNLKSFDIKQLTGDTFMLTKCYQVHLVVVNSESEVQNFWLFVKITPDCQPDIYDSAQFHHLFTNEIIAYTRIIPIFDLHNKYVKLQDYDVQRSSSYLVLDDFSKCGWRLAKVMVNLSLDHIYVAMKELAFFHGKFYALKIQNIDKFMEIAKQLHESRYTSNVHENCKAGMVAATKRAINSVRNSELKDKIPESFVQNLAHLLQESHIYGKKMVQSTDPFSTFCHGDYLRNNIAFRFDENEIPTEAMMFDFQTIRHSSPMVDVCVFLCNSTGIDIRGPNFDNIFDQYFDNLIQTIKNDLKVELPEYFNRKRFLQEYVKFLPLGLSVASFFLPVMTNKDDINLDFNKLVSPEETAKQIMTFGGESVDRELRSIVHQMYTLSEELNVDIFST